MYLNKNNSTAAHIYKGNNGERLFAKWCKLKHIPYREATKEEDYVGKVDFFIHEDKKVAVKSNYSEHYNTVCIEWKQLKDDGQYPQAWLWHDTDFVAFVVKKDVYLVDTKRLQEYITVHKNEFSSYIRAQGRFKGTYKLLFLPLPELKQLI